MTDSIRWAANLSLLFTELPLLSRPEAAKRAGFDEIEFWWPFDSGVPAQAVVQAFVDAIQDAHVDLTAMNLFGGDMQGGERGVLSYPERKDEFRASVRIAAEIGRALGTRLFNVPYGHRRPDLDIETQTATADDNLDYATTVMGEFNGTVMLEPLSGWPLYPLMTAEDALSIIGRLRATRGITNLALLLDQYHLESNGTDVFRLLDEHSDQIVHVQIADVPGRGEPGSGASELSRFVDRLGAVGYTGAVALEYIPTTSTEDSLREWNNTMRPWRGREDA
jgi:hydroxypyruvate isomerase